MLTTAFVERDKNPGKMKSAEQMVTTEKKTQRVFLERHSSGIIIISARLDHACSFTIGLSVSGSGSLHFSAS